MNIFILDTDVGANARAHCDKHVVKMILESAQMLCTVANELGVESPYRSTHKHHPSTKWAALTRQNYQWLYELMLALNEEFMYRFGHTQNHLSVDKFIRGVNLADVLSKLPDDELTPFAQAMPDEYKNDDAVKAYRDYYNNVKKDILHYTKRAMPYWVKGNNWYEATI
jgi:hypothetical protein